MSDFSFDPPKASAFQRLISGSVGSAGRTPAANQPQSRSDAGLFREVPAALSGLSSAVSNNAESTDALVAMRGAREEVQRSNEQASEVSVRDVQAAVQVADDLRDRIRENLRVASEAQAKGLSAESIQRFLG